MGSTSVAGPVPTSSLQCVPSSSASVPSSSSSVRVSFDAEDQENVTITTKRAITKKADKRKSSDDIRLLAVSTHMTELSYAISDIQTRIFELQELRHKSQSNTDTADAGTTSVIDQQLMSLDERLETVEKGVRTINEALEPLLRTAATPTMSERGSPSENTAILRKHATLLAEWETVQEESETLREELKEDKWLTVFRTVTDQADGMMSSLEKAVNRCQEFIWQVHRRPDDFQSNATLLTSGSDKSPINFEVYTSLLDSYEAKKKHYMPATSKVLSIIDKGVRDRVTKNGETLRRHAESAQRWKNLRDRITRTDKDMENIRKVFLNGDSDHESSTSGTASSKNGYLVTPPSRVSRISSTGSLSLSGSISPFRKIANKITGSRKSSYNPRTIPVSPLSVTKKALPIATESPPSVSTTGTMRRQRQSVLDTFQIAGQGVPSTPERLGHKHSHSDTLSSSPRGPERPEINATIKGNNSSKQPWNSSTKIENESKGTIRKPSSRPPSSTGNYSYRDDIPPVPLLSTPYRRSASRTSMASSRPWSPLTSSYSTTHSSSQFHLPTPSLTALRPPSRSHTPARAKTPSLSATPRHRPKTPSLIPGPKTSRSISLGAGLDSGGNWDNDISIGRSHSPAFSVSGYGGSSPHPPRPPSRSMIPVPSVHLRTPSRPSSAMSDFSRSESPTMMRRFREEALRAQTPENALRLRTRQLPVYQGTVGRSGRPPMPKLPPSSFKDRDGSTSHGSSRPSSRAGAYTPSVDGQNGLPLYEYVPNEIDPLDVEVANIVNSMPHGLLVERVDPPLKKSQVPKEGAEIKAQYASSNSLNKKIVTCKLTTLTRSGKAGEVTMKKVMCRVGGGWQDLQMYILNRQAGSA